MISQSIVRPSNFGRENWRSFPGLALSSAHSGPALSSAHSVLVAKNSRSRLLHRRSWRAPPSLLDGTKNDRFRATGAADRHRRRSHDHLLLPTSLPQPASSQELDFSSFQELSLLKPPPQLSDF